MWFHLMREPVYFVLFYRCYCYCFFCFVNQIKTTFAQKFNIVVLLFLLNCFIFLALTLNLLYKYNTFIIWRKLAWVYLCVRMGGWVCICGCSENAINLHKTEFDNKFYYFFCGVLLSDHQLNSVFCTYTHTQCCDFWIFGDIFYHRRDFWGCVILGPVIRNKPRVTNENP